MRSSMLLSIAAAALPAASAWWATGHMVTGQIAYNLLTPTTKGAVDALADSLADSYPASPDFVTSTVWPDDLKSLGVGQYSAWHYIDLPVVQSAVYFTVPQPGNLSVAPWAIASAVRTLTSTVSTSLDKAIQLRFLLHFAGDVHQPLHCASLFSAQFPDSDAGGNGYKIAGVSGITNLHSLWDSVGNTMADDPDRPLNASGAAFIADIATSVSQEYPKAAFNSGDLTDLSPWDWSSQSWGIADAFTYTAPQSPTPVPAAYMTTTINTARRQLALGGYRLAAVLEGVFNPSAPAYIKTAIAAMVNTLNAAEGLTVGSAAGRARALRSGRN